MGRRKRTRWWAVGWKPSRSPRKAAVRNSSPWSAFTPAEPWAQAIKAASRWTRRRSLPPDTAFGRRWKSARFAYSQIELISDLSGNLVGYLKVRGIYTVSQSGDEYAGNSFAEIFDTAGNVLFSVDVTNAGQRIQLELP